MIGELCAYHVGYHVGVFLRGTMVFYLHCVEVKMQLKRTGFNKIHRMDILTQLTCCSEKLVDILNLHAYSSDLGKK